MQKYGIEHFHVELLEETDNPEERERYWIEIKGSFKNGYNATIGGDGKRYLDYDLIVISYKELNSAKKVAQKLGYSVSQVEKVLKEKNYNLVQKKIDGQKKPIAKCNKDTGEVIEIFASIKDAALSIDKHHRHIGECANGKRKSAYGYSWKFLPC